jgi:hypothetical protein
LDHVSILIWIAMATPFLDLGSHWQKSCEDALRELKLRLGDMVAIVAEKNVDRNGFCSRSFSLI